MGFICVFIVSVVCRLVAPASVTTTPSTVTNCLDIKEIFNLKNISVQVPDVPVKGSGICGEGLSCCSAKMEGRLQQTVTKDLYGLLHHNFHSVHGLLATTAANIQEQVRQLGAQSENKTMVMFSEVYEKMWGLVKEPISEMYAALMGYIERGSRIPTNLPSAVPTDDGAVLEQIVDNFFGKMFPLVYHQAIHHLDSRDFSDEYKKCLRDNIDTIKPFELLPKTMGKSVAKSFESTKVFLEALSLGIEVLSTTDDLMSNQNENTDTCREALLKLYYCPKCLGLPAKVKPCNGYCLNVMRGCLTQQRTTELDLPWSNFLMETQNLVREIRLGHLPSIDYVLNGLSTKISDAIMYATLEGPAIERKVKRACGAPKLTEKVVEGGQFFENRTESTVTVSSEDKGKVSELAQELDKFVEAIDKTKATGFYANLAEALCSDDSFAETRDTAECWNGHRVGEYMKALVKQGLDSQKYNPELKWTPTPPEPSIELLSEKLRHMRQLVASKRPGKRSLTSDSLIREEGSGSGGGPIDGRGGIDQEDDNAYDNSEGSGSGYGGITNGGGSPVDDNSLDDEVESSSEQKHKTVQTTGSSSHISSSMAVIFIATVIRWLC